MVSGAKMFTAASRHAIISTVNVLDFIYSCIRSYKINKTNMLATNLIYTGSYTSVMNFKCLPEPRNRLKMLHKNYQSLLLPDSLFMH